MVSIRTLVLAAAALGGPAFGAEPAVTCHCFRTRTFDPARPGAADPYILATTRSSLLSVAFGVAKGSLVRAVMSGTASDDLWIAYWAAARTGTDAAALLDSRHARGSWKAALADAQGLPSALSAALARGAADSEIAALAVDEVLLQRLGADSESLRAMHAAGARSDEAVAAAFLARRLGTLPPLVLARVRTGSATWGTELRGAGLAPDQIDAAVRSVVGPEAKAR